MTITIFAAGSRGDIQPCAALGVGLKAAGYAVRMAVPSNFSDFVKEQDLEFFPLRGDVRQIMASDEARDFLERGGANPIRAIRVMRRLIAPVMREMMSDAFDACRGASALICPGVFSPIGKSIAEALRIPLINMEPTPLLPTGAFQAASWPIQKNLGAIHNHFSGLAMLYSVWLWYQPFVREFRKDHGLDAGSARYFYQVLRTTPLLGAYSPAIIPHPSDWPASVHITGDFQLRAKADWQPPAGLVDFLESGDPPVYIGFGSMFSNNAEELAKLITDALDMCGQRGLILTGWGGIPISGTTGRVFSLESAPHDWLFPRMAAVVHHGGAGTTAEGLRAGIPTVIIPFNFDQFFWGARIKEKGLGPEPIPRKKLTARRLAEAIRFAVTDPLVRKRAAECGATIRATDGVGNAVEIIKQYLGVPDIGN